MPIYRNRKNHLDSLQATEMCFLKKLVFSKSTIISHSKNDILKEKANQDYKKLKIYVFKSRNNCLDDSETERKKKTI